MIEGTQEALAIAGLGVRFNNAEIDFDETCDNIETLIEDQDPVVVLGLLATLAGTWLNETSGSTEESMGFIKDLCVENSI